MYLFRIHKEVTAHDQGIDQGIAAVVAPATGASIAVSYPLSVDPHEVEHVLHLVARHQPVLI